MRRDNEPQAMPLDPRVERLIAWAGSHIPGANAALAALERETTAGGTLIAGGIAYRLFLWLLPFSLLVASVASFWDRSDPQGLDDSAQRFGLSSAAAASMRKVVEDGAHERWYFLVFGLGFALWFAIGVVRALRLANSIAWRVGRGKMRRPIVVGINFTLFMTASILFTGLAQWARQANEGAGLVVTLLLVFVYAGGALWALTRLPHGDAPWTALIPGAVLIALGVQGVHLFVVLYLGPKLGRSSELYGSLGTATVILLWLYVIARLFTISAFLNAELWDRRTSSSRPAEGS
jgi:uncharacterized BrkB/YihY/UPF0761 family membrane protein